MPSIVSCSISYHPPADITSLEAMRNQRPWCIAFFCLILLLFLYFYLFLLHLVSSQQGYSVLDNIRQDRTRRRKEKTKQYFRPVVSVSFHNRLRTPISFYAFCSTEKERIERIKKTSKSSVSGLLGEIGTCPNDSRFNFINFFFIS